MGILRTVQSTRYFGPDGKLTSLGDPQAADGTVVAVKRQPDGSVLSELFPTREAALADKPTISERTTYSNAQGNFREVRCG